MHCQCRTFVHPLCLAAPEGRVSWPHMQLDWMLSGAAPDVTGVIAQNASFGGSAGLMACMVAVWSAQHLQSSQEACSLRAQQRARRLTPGVVPVTWLLHQAVQAQCTPGESSSPSAGASGAGVSQMVSVTNASHAAASDTPSAQAALKRQLQTRNACSACLQSPQPGDTHDKASHLVTCVCLTRTLSARHAGTVCPAARSSCDIYCALHPMAWTCHPGAGVVSPCKTGFSPAMLRAGPSSIRVKQRGMPCSPHFHLSKADHKAQLACITQMMARKSMSCSMACSWPAGGTRLLCTPTSLVVTLLQDPQHAYSDVLQALAAAARSMLWSDKACKANMACSECGLVPGTAEVAAHHPLTCQDMTPHSMPCRRSSSSYSY